MNYEEFYQQMQVFEKGIKDKTQLAQKYQKSISKNSEKGDLKSLSKDLTQMKAVLTEYEGLIGEMTELANSFDAKQYMESGEFASQMIEYCKNLSVDVTGDYPTYQMFPYKVRIDSDNQDMYVDRKKVQCVRPLSFVKDIKQSQDKLMKSSFNATSFVNELAAAYDLAVKLKAKTMNNIEASYDLHLKDLYEYMAPMQRFRKDYDLQNYAYDLSRIYQNNDLITKDGRSFEFGSSKITKKLIRIIDNDGNEQFLGTIRFFTKN